MRQLPNNHQWTNATGDWSLQKITCLRKCYHKICGWEATLDAVITILTGTEIKVQEMFWVLAIGGTLLPSPPLQNCLFKIKHIFIHQSYISNTKHFSPGLYTGGATWYTNICLIWSSEILSQAAVFSSLPQAGATHRKAEQAINPQPMQSLPPVRKPLLPHPEPSPGQVSSPPCRERELCVFRT